MASDHHLAHGLGEPVGHRCSLTFSGVESRPSGSSVSEWHVWCVLGGGGGIRESYLPSRGKILEALTSSGDSVRA